MLERLTVRSYRSLREVTIELGRLTVVTGANGSGKSNLYRSLQLLQAAAEGRFATALLAEGGMPSALWAGAQVKGPVRLLLQVGFHDLTYELTAGLPKIDPDTSSFVLDPEIKKEFIHLGRKRMPSTTLVDRSGSGASLTAVGGEINRITGTLRSAESVMGQVGQPHLYPELAEIQRRLRGWRFYHQFDTGLTSPIRSRQPGVRTFALSSTGDDLGASVATLIEQGHFGFLAHAIESAFPGCEVIVDGEPGHFEVGLIVPSLQRPLRASELSDGQLRFLCLATALLSARPPELLVLNEPETSLHPAAIAALAPLIHEAARFSQVWVTTHDPALRHALGEAVTAVHLELRDGRTSVIPEEG